MGAMAQLRIPAVYMRGGTSKGVFFWASDLPRSGPRPLLHTPWLSVLMVFLVIVTYVPQLSLWLPHLMLRRKPGRAGAC